MSCKSVNFLTIQVCAALIAGSTLRVSHRLTRYVLHKLTKHLGTIRTAGGIRLYVCHGSQIQHSREQS